MKYTLRLFIALWLSCGLTAVALANPTQLPIGAKSVKVEPFAEILLDKEGRLSAEHVASSEMAAQFKPMGNTLALGFIPDTVWLKITLLSEQDSDWWLEVGQPVLESVQLYKVEDDTAGSAVKVSSVQSIEARRPSFYIDLQANTPKVLYLRLWSRTSMTSSLTLWRTEALLPQVQQYNLISGIVLGAYLLVIAFYALFSFWTSAKIHIYYTLYVCVNFMAAFFTGAWNYTLGWPLEPPVHTTLLGIFISLAMVFSSLFTVEFVQSRREWPKLSNIYIFSCTIAASASIIAILNSYYREAQIYFQSLTILTILFTTFALLYLTHTGNKRARFLLIALSIFHIGIAWRFMRNIGLIEPNSFNDNAYQIGAFVHMLIMSTGIFSSYNKLRQESEKQKARADAEADLRQRQKEFLNIVAHEVKTPLSVISAAADNLQISPTTHLSDLARVEKIIRNAEKIHLSFENYLGKEQILNNNIEDHIRPLNLSDLCGNVVKDFQETHEVQISGTIEPGAIITGDADLLSVAIANLLDNAHKHNPKGTHITLNLTVESTNEIIICVEDEGLGVLNEDLARLFDAYFRGGNAKATAGSGLGLHLVKYIAEQHHGSAIAMRREGGGLRVVLNLPLKQD